MTLTINDLDAHGFDFIFGENRYKSTKILWTFLIFLSFCGFSFYVYEIRQKWELSPDIITTIKGGKLNEFPSPALSICPNIFARKNLVNYEKVYNQTFFPSKNKLYELDEEKCEILFANIHWCNKFGYEIAQEYNCTMKENFNIAQTIKNTSLKINEFFYNCSLWFYPKNYLRDCTQVFTSILTDFGVCFAFNMQNFDSIFNSENIHKDFKFNHKKQKEVQWSVEKGYFNKNSSYPYRAGRPFDASFIFYVDDLDEDNFCGSYQEFKVFIHRPSEIPTVFHENYEIGFRKNLIYFINIESHRTSSELRRYTPDLRRCYFEDERKLYYFKAYTKALCDWECQANWTLKNCGCVKFSMPRNKSIPVCDENGIECSRIYSPNYPKASMIPCDCFPPCNDISYSTGSSTLFYTSGLESSDKLNSIEIGSRTLAI